MPAKFRLKKYLPGGIYHIYSRGIDEVQVFKDDGDYQKFVEILKRYLLPYTEKAETGFKSERPYIARHRKLMNMEQEIKLLAYCLLPDHFHLVIWQRDADGITKFMRRIMTNYVMEYNLKYKRHGNLFYGVYRAVNVPMDERLVLLSKYVHLNLVSKTVRRYGLLETMSGPTPEYYTYSSYQDYLGSRVSKWLDMEIVTTLVKEKLPEEESYKTFMEKEEKNHWAGIVDVILEELR